jgi:hypothetical protein
MRSSPALWIIIGASLIAHAVFITAAFLTPRTPPPPRHPYADCGAPAPSPGDAAPGGGGSLATGTGDGWGAPGTGSAGASGSLGTRAVTTVELRYLPCCGPGCVRPLDVDGKD